MLIGVAALAVSWVLAPWVAMARHGTIDEQQRAQQQAEWTIPSPRRAPDDLPSPARRPVSR